mmetsp:Transcript_28986/g.74514  ORF Transcript_28986/g.74514 Transcript_28986/m.74514 type:complete len:231 (+) Transcript_28986:374-1066(+)
MATAGRDGGEAANAAAPPCRGELVSLARRSSCGSRPCAVSDRIGSSTSSHDHADGGTSFTSTARSPSSGASAQIRHRSGLQAAHGVDDPSLGRRQPCIELGARALLVLPYERRHALLHVKRTPGPLILLALVPLTPHLDEACERPREPSQHPAQPGRRALLFYIVLRHLEPQLLIPIAARLGGPGSAAAPDDGDHRVKLGDELEARAAEEELRLDDCTLVRVGYDGDEDV